jgi:hypothetical protein
LQNGTGIEVPVRETSFGNQMNMYKEGVEVSGVLVDNYFNICREFHHNRKGKLFGYIKENDKDDEWTKIVIMEDFRPKMMASVSFYPDSYEVGEELTARKSLISNF